MVTVIMTEESTYSLSEDIRAIYSGIRPSLVSMAYNFKVNNPVDYTEEWQTKAYSILSKFDSGALKPRLYLDSSKSKLVDYDPKEHSKEMLVSGIKSYLVKSFANDLIKNSNSKKRDSAFLKRAMQAQAQISPDKFYQASNTIEKSITIQEFVEVVSFDLERLYAPITINDKVQKIFLEALVEVCESMKRSFGNLRIALNVNTTSKRKFFTDDFKCDLETEIVKILCDRTICEKNPLVVKRLSALINQEKKSAIKNKIYRYLFDYKGGMPKRLAKRLDE